MKTVNDMWFTAQDVQVLFGVAQTKAYQIIKELSEKLVTEGYSRPPHGKIQKQYLCEKYRLDKTECETILAETKKQSAS